MTESKPFFLAKQAQRFLPDWYVHTARIFSFINLFLTSPIITNIINFTGIQVASQSAEKSFAQLKAHLEKEATKIEGVEVSLKGLKFMADPIKLGKSSVGIAAARSVLSKLYGREPSYFYMGGSIPAVTLLYDVLGLETVVFAFANSDEMVHAPNEFGRLSSFRRGQEAYVRMLWELRERHSKIGDEQRDEL